MSTWYRPKQRPSVSYAEIFGLRPLEPALRQCKRAIFGNDRVPASLWGPSSLSIFKPKVSLPTWAGLRRRDKKAIIYLLYNRVAAPQDVGYSVKVTFARDFRGSRMTYDGHVGTDFAVPVGTRICAIAPGRVMRVQNDMERGGLKVVVDHGGNLVSTYNHLSRNLVEVGTRVARGQSVGLSGMSGVDGVLFFPWLAPHLHLNVLLNGAFVDPFAAEGETSLWTMHNAPEPHRGPLDDEYQPSEYSAEGIAAAIATAKDPAFRARVERLGSLEEQAIELMMEHFLRRWSFDSPPQVYADTVARRPVASLPLHRDDFDGIPISVELWHYSISV